MTNATELIKITTNESGVSCVSARELHEGLGVEQRFNDWINRRIKKYGFEENTDYTCLTQKRVTQRTNGQKGTATEKDYIITIDMAKELCMVENNDLGRKFRKYFIACEKKLQEVQQPKQMSDNELIAKALLLVNEKYEQAKVELTQTKAELTEKTEFIDDINDCFTFTQVSQFNRQLLKDRKDIVLSTATLNKVAAELCIPINKIDNPIVYSPYKRVNAYPRKVWMSAYPDIKLPEKESK